jgi:hypothetical protein
MAAFDEGLAEGHSDVAAADDENAHIKILLRESEKGTPDPIQLCQEDAHRLGCAS